MNNGDSSAFGIPSSYGDGQVREYGAPGLTKREYIATHLFAGTVSAVVVEEMEIPLDMIDELATNAVTLADALLRALGKQGKEGE